MLPFSTKSRVPLGREARQGIRICDDCRVIVQFEATDNPLAAGPRPQIRTTDDYLREREEIEAARAKVKAERDADA